MNRKNNNLAFFTLLVVGLFSSLTLNIFAQKATISKTEQPQSKCTGEKFVLPSSISIGNEAFASYLKAASLPVKERRTVFSALSNEEKANFFKIQYALQFIKRPNMTVQQRDFILEAVSKISPDLYDTNNVEKARLSEQIGLEIESKAFGLFTPSEAGDILAALFAKKDEDVALLQKYENLLKNGTKARKKIVREMPVNDRVNIWKTQLVYHLATARLSKAQSEFIVEFLTNLSPAFFEHSANLTREESAKALAILDKKILSVFSRAEEYAIFEELGIQNPVTDTAETDLLAAPGECDCRWYCGPYNGTCGSGSCNIGTLDCGPAGTWLCYSKCG